MLQLRPYDIGCQPSPSVPAETLIQDGWSTYLLFFAVPNSTSTDGQLEDLGVAILECRACAATKFGYPNDEGLPEHPLYTYGLADATTSVLEVVGSTWAKEVSDQMEKSALRIWRNRPAQNKDLRHFLMPMKEVTFECVAASLVVVRYSKSFEEALSFVHAKLAEH